jgi:hypothetical protein
MLRVKDWILFAGGVAQSTKQTHAPIKTAEALTFFLKSSKQQFVMQMIAIATLVAQKQSFSEKD